MSQTQSIKYMRDVLGEASQFERLRANFHQLLCLLANFFFFFFFFLIILFILGEQFGIVAIFR